MNSKASVTMDDWLDELLNEERESKDGNTVDNSDYFVNHPAFVKEIDWTKPLSPTMEALQALQYDEDDPEECASSYKDDGNNLFKLKKYRIAIDNYTAGIKLRCKNKELNSVLFSNRAAAHFRIANYGSAFKDCIAARMFKSDYMKAIIKGAQCCFELKRPEKCKIWCDEGLKFDDKNEVLLELRARADKQQKEILRNRRKSEMKQRNDEIEEKKILHAIKERGISMEGDDQADMLHEKFMENIRMLCPSRHLVHLSEDGYLVWPVLFLYPEFGETDIINEFQENTCFEDHLNCMFGDGGEPAGWNLEGKYRPDTIDIFIENKEKVKLWPVPPETTLSSVLSNSKIGYMVKGATPSFILLLKNSPYRSKFLKEYNMS